MLKRLGLPVLLGLGLCTGYQVSAEAQAAARDPVYEITRNKIGLLRYCRDKGLLDAETTEKAIESNRIVFGVLPVPADTSHGDAAEKAGENGKWGSRRQDIAQHATMLDTTPAALCKEWAE